MKRGIIAVFCLVSAVALCIAGYITLSKTCRELQPPLKEIAECAAQDNREEAIKKSEEFAEVWENKHGRIEALTPHAEIDELEEIIKSLPTLARQGNMERLHEQSLIAFHRLDHIVKNEKPNYSNIF